MSLPNSMEQSHQTHSQRSWSALPSSKQASKSVRRKVEHFSDAGKTSRPVHTVALASRTQEKNAEDTRSSLKNSIQLSHFRDFAAYSKPTATPVHSATSPVLDLHSEIKRSSLPGQSSNDNMPAKNGDTNSSHNGRAISSSSVGLSGREAEQKNKLTWQQLLDIDTSTLKRAEKARLEAHLTQEEKNSLRKARISAKMKGMAPWNKGSAWNSEIKEKIRASVTVAMKRPETLEKLRINHYPKFQTQETKDKISMSLRTHYALEKQVIQELLTDPSGKSVDSVLATFHGVDNGRPVRPASVNEFAKLMPPGILSKETLTDNASSKLLAKHFSPASLKRIISAAQRVLAGTSAESSGDEEAVANLRRATSGVDRLEGSPDAQDVPELREKENHRLRPKEEEHRRAIADAIRRKWEDPEYRQKRMQGLNKKSADSRERPAKPTAKQKTSDEGPSKSKAKPVKKAASTATKRKASQAKKAASGPDQISSAMLDRLKEQEMAMLKKQNQRLAKLNVAKELVLELEAVLGNLPSDSDLGPGDNDMKQSIVEAQQLLSQAKSRVRALESPSSGRNKSNFQQKLDSEERLQSAMVMLNMDDIDE